jgi:hypothetical protein
MPYYLHKLKSYPEMKNNFTIGMRSILPQNVEETRIIPFVLSIASRDRHNTVLNQDKWKLDNFKKNPVVTYMHSDGSSVTSSPNPDYVIGRGIDTHVEGQGKLGQLVDKILFDPVEVNLLAEKIFRKCLIGTLNAASVLFNEIGKGQWGSGQEAKGQPTETYYLAGQELLSWSIVNIPSNPYSVKRNASVEGSAMGAIMYFCKELGYSFTYSQIRKMRVRDVLDLLEGKDLGIRTTDPAKARKLISDPQAQKELNERIEREQKKLSELIRKTDTLLKSHLK